MSETLLTITNIGFPPLSARGCRQELIPIPNGEFRKTINGDLVFIKTSEEQKYKTVIKCSDMNCPATGNIWIGRVVEIGCIQNIWQNYDDYTADIELSRDPVDGSVVVIDSDGNHIKHDVDGRKVRLRAMGNGMIYVAFRPKMKMLITDFRIETNEWDLTSSWTLSAEET